MTKDPVCGMDVDERKTNYLQKYENKTYFFCGPDCDRRFKENPAPYVRGKAEVGDGE